MKKVDFKEYVERYHYCSEVSEEQCYMGGHYCGSCMHCFPGNYCVSLSGYDGRAVCTCARREEDSHGWRR